MSNQSRKWLITCNNPKDYNYSLDFLKGALATLKNLGYWCYSLEVGEEGTEHFHLFLYRKSPIKFELLKSKFPKAHFDFAKGSCVDNRNYVFKEGKWLNDKKGETNIRTSHFEWGEIPIERQGARNDLADLYDLITGGASDVDIISENPNYIMQIDKFDKIRQAYRQKQFAETFRNLDVTYIFGEAGVGKTRYVMETYGYKNVYRVTDYAHPFDYYAGQDVILFDEFRSSVKIVDMLNYLDGYPLMLPCRYNNKVACYTKVYIVSNIPIEKQYPEIQHKEQTTYKAFMRRINNILEFAPIGLIPVQKAVQIGLNGEEISAVGTIRKR